MLKAFAGNGSDAVLALKSGLTASFFLGLAACAAAAPASTAAPPAPAEATRLPDTPGVSGRRPSPAASPGQSLPLTPTRAIRFETSEGTMLSLDVAPDGETLVFDMLGDIYRLNIEGGDAEVLTRGLALDTQPVYAPDGQTIAFLSDRSGAENLWLINADGSEPRQLSYYDDNPHWTSPEWSPDGTTIIATRFWPDRNAYELWQFNASKVSMGSVLRSNGDGGETGNYVSTLGARYAPDSQTIITSSLDQAPSFDDVSPWKIIRYDPATGISTHLVDAGIGAAFRPALSPNGRSLVHAVRRDGNTWLRALTLSTGQAHDLIRLDPDSLEASLWHDAVPRFDFMPDGQSVIVNTAGKLLEIPLSGASPSPIPFKATIDQSLGPLVRHQAPAESGPVRARLIMAPAESRDATRLVFSALGRLFTASLAQDAAPIRLTPDTLPAYHPSWSPDDELLAFVSWTKKDGGAIWTVNPDGTRLSEVTADGAFYCHPVFTPDGLGVVAVRSPAEDRDATYMEYGQLRDAELVVIPLDGNAPRTLYSGRIGGTPHFLSGDPDSVLINTGKGVEAISLASGQSRVVTEAEGPNWYFAEGSAPADDLRVSPDGKWALALIAQQLHLYQVPQTPGASVDLTYPGTRHAQLTRIGADYFDWAEGGDVITWSIGSTYKRLRLDEVSFDAPRPAEVRAGIMAYDMPVTISRDTPQGAILLTGANVITMDDRSAPDAVLNNHDVLIQKDRIAAIGPAGSLAAPDSAQTIDVSGLYIMPGLIDAHYHVADIRRDVLQFDAWGLKTNLAYGVTTLFDPSSLTIDMLAYQDLLEAGEITGSRLFTTGPAIFDFNDFQSKSEVRDVLRRYRDQYRLHNIKQYRSGNRRVRQWIADAANELGLTPTTEGALSFKLGLTHILDGYSGNEHALPPPVLHRDVTELFARSGTSSTLTLMITHGGLPADDVFIARHEAMSDEKYARFAPDWFREDHFADPDTRPADAYLYDTVAASAHRIHNAGGIVGIGAHGDIPGLGTHWEIEAYVDGGWSPAEALWAATMGSATAIARDASLGSIIPGKLADLVILNSNPLEDITRTSDLRFVMKNGRLYDDETLRLARPH